MRKPKTRGSRRAFILASRTLALILMVLVCLPASPRVEAAGGLVPVSYLACGGTGGYVEAASTGSYTVKVPASVGIVRPGFTFSGWNTAPDGTGTPVAAGAAVPLSAPLTLYAQWEFPMQHNIVYQPNGASQAPHIDTVYENILYTIKSPNDIGFSLLYHSFLRWDTDPAGLGSAYQPGDTLTVTGDLMLYAQWEPLTVDLTFVNESLGQTTVTTGQGTSYNMPNPADFGLIPPPGKSTLREWNTRPDGSGSAYQPGTSYPVGTQGETFYAIWD